MFQTQNQQVETVLADLDYISGAAGYSSALEAAAELNRYAASLHQLGLISGEQLAECHAQIDQALGERLMNSNPAATNC